MGLVANMANVGGEKSNKLYKMGLDMVSCIDIDPISAAYTFSELSNAMLSKFGMFYKAEKKTDEELFNSATNLLDELIGMMADGEEE